MVPFFNKKNLILFLIILCSCNISQRLYIKGKYDEAITRAVKKLKKHPDKEKEAIYLEKSYITANKLDNEKINYLKLEGKPENWDKILFLYEKLKKRQTLVQTILPIKLKDRDIYFERIDYDKDIINAKNNAAEFWYAKGEQLLQLNNRFKSREAYTAFNNVKYYFSTYKDLDKLIELSYNKGITKVGLFVTNKSNVQFGFDLKDFFNTLDFKSLESKWVRYYIGKENNNYHYFINLKINFVNVSPGNILVREKIYTKKIQDGTEFLLDANNNIVKDSTGKPIKVPRMVEVSCKVIETIQQKLSFIEGEIIYFDIENNTEILIKPTRTDFLFEDITYIANGDLRALDKEITNKLGKLPSPLPDDHFMIGGALNTLKNIYIEQLKQYTYYIK